MIIKNINEMIESVADIIIETDINRPQYTIQIYGYYNEKTCEMEITTYQGDGILIDNHFHIHTIHQMPNDYTDVIIMEMATIEDITGKSKEEIVAEMSDDENPSESEIWKFITSKYDNDVIEWYSSIIHENYTDYYLAAGEIVDSFLDSIGDDDNWQKCLVENRGTLFERR